MPLELRKQRDGKTLRPNWYGRFEVEGKRYLVTLGKIEGKPPKSLSLTDQGDKTFEKSRVQALADLEVKARELREKRDAAHWVKRLHEIQHGEKIKGFPVTDLVQAWERSPRKKKKRTELHPRYVVDVHATFRRFVEFLQEKHPNVKDAAQVSRLVAGEFVEAEEKRGLSAKARNDTLKRLKAAFHTLQVEDFTTRNPFDGFTAMTEDTVHRRPLTPEEIGSVLKAVENDDFTRPLIVCALSTAMRRGDCCCLKWEDVHLDGKDDEGRPVLDHVIVKTSKTGETVTAPVDERLKAELIRAKAKASGASEYVWPEQATMQGQNQQGVTWRIRQAFKRAGLDDEDTHAERKDGIRRASVVDFHSLRTTWITDKLAAGIPIEAVKRTSGHRTTEVVMQYYNKPRVQQHLKTLTGNGFTHSRDAELREIIRRMKPNTLKKDKALALAILDGKP